MSNFKKLLEPLRKVAAYVLVALLLPGGTVLCLAHLLFQRQLRARSSSIVPISMSSLAPFGYLHRRLRSVLEYLGNTIYVAEGGWLGSWRSSRRPQRFR
jgi:hypothetical protein